MVRLVLAFICLIGVVNAKEHRQRIVIIDGGLRSHLFKDPGICRGLHKDFTGEGFVDPTGHGTNIEGIIRPAIDAAKQCIVVIKYYSVNQTMERNTRNLHKALYYTARIKNVLIVNFSSSGFGGSTQEHDLFKDILLTGAAISCAAGNEAIDLSIFCVVYPACYRFNSDKWFIVGSEDYKGANYAGPVNTLEHGLNVCSNGICMTGTSQATANHTANYIKQRRKKK